MKETVCVILDAKDGKSVEVANTLAHKEGVVAADVMEHQHGVMMIVEASGRKQLAALTMRAVDAVKNLTHGVRLLPHEADTKRFMDSVDTTGRVPAGAGVAGRGVKNASAPLASFAPLG